MRNGLGIGFGKGLHDRSFVIVRFCQVALGQEDEECRARSSKARNMRALGSNRGVAVVVGENFWIEWRAVDYWLIIRHI
jgi:hypothetical protein